MSGIQSINDWLVCREDFEVRQFTRKNPAVFCDAEIAQRL
jgi:hypothetical protein